MLSSIHPFGERSRNRRWAVTVGFYLAGSVLGGAAVGAAAGGLGRVADLVGVLPSTDAAIAILAVACLIGAALDLGLLRVPRPSWHRQVNEVWLTAYRGWVYGFGFGFQLGLGVVTIITTATVHLFLLAALLTGSVAAGLVIGTTFGLARGLFIFAAARVQTPEQLRSLHRRLADQATTTHRLTIAAVVAVAGAALVAALA